MTAPVPPAEPNTDALVQMLYDGIHDATCSDHGPHCDQFKPQIRDAIRVGIDRLSAAGYRIVKDGDNTHEHYEDWAVLSEDGEIYSVHEGTHERAEHEAALLRENEPNAKAIRRRRCNWAEDTVWDLPYDISYEWGVSYEKTTVAHPNEATARLHAGMHNRPVVRRTVREASSWEPVEELRGEYGEFEWAVRYDEGVVRVKDDRKHAEDCARIVNRSEGPPAQVVQRRVGPWTPVDEENCDG